jgi:hypothetical protein
MRFNVQGTQFASEYGNFLFLSSQQEGRSLKHLMAAKVTKTAKKFEMLQLTLVSPTFFQIRK